ncbi:MAG: lipopolysaccharide kinase InaA family protein [Planctomycetota bacterium]
MDDVRERAGELPARAAPGGAPCGPDPGASGAHRADAELLLDAEPAAVLRRVGARTTCVVELDGAPCIVKRDLERSGWRRLFGARASAAEREHANLVELARDGVPVPRAIAWIARDGVDGRASAVAMERIEHDATLRERLAIAPADERRAWAERLAVLVADLHARGWYHRDLYLQHVVLRRGASDERALVLLDVGRARRERAPRERWFVKDVAALLHSTPRVVTTHERLRFLARYLDLARVADRRARRRFLARVVAKERRMAAHVPRAGETRPWEDR